MNKSEIIRNTNWIFLSILLLLLITIISFIYIENSKILKY